MTGLEVIIAALVAGAASGTSQTAGTAIGDAYAGLRDGLRRRLAGRADAVRQLDAEPTGDPQVWRARLGPDLDASGAEHDEEILAAARRVLALAARPAPKYSVNIHGSEGVQIGDGNTMHLGTGYGPVPPAQP